MEETQLKLPDITSTEQTLSRELFRNSEHSMVHTSYREELAILFCVRDGDVKRLAETYERLPKIIYGQMSARSDRQLFYGSIANTTLVTRYAIEGGLDEEEAFSLSDIYIRKMENLSDAELEEMNIQMALDFTERVHQVQKKKRQYSMETEAALDYIYEHRHEHIFVEDLASAANLSLSFFSKKFHQETGMTPAAYIRRRKIEEARNLLRFSDYSYSEIAEYLQFSSQSHFTYVFRKETGKTPQEYRLLIRQKASDSHGDGSSGWTATGTVLLAEAKL